MDDLFKSVISETAGISANHPLAPLLSARGEILRLTQKSHDAVLRPEIPGGLSHGERAALACRMARLNDEELLAHHYAALIPEDSESRAMADPAFFGSQDQRLAAILRHTDLVTVKPGETTEDDISSLKLAGILEADIVRLSELIAFLGYQVRLIQGLRLMVEAS